MNKSELVAAVAEKAGLTQTDAAAAIGAFEQIIVGAVSGGEKVSLPGFLTFEKGHRAARTGKNPQTGAAIQIAAADVPKVKVGKSFKDAVNS